MAVKILLVRDEIHGWGKASILYEIFWKLRQTWHMRKVKRHDRLCGFSQVRRGNHRKSDGETTGNQ